MIVTFREGTSPEQLDQFVQGITLQTTRVAAGARAEPERLLVNIYLQPGVSAQQRQVLHDAIVRSPLVVSVVDNS